MLVASLVLAAGLPGETGSRTCAPCHTEIFQRYQRSPMARTSGALPRLPAARVAHGEANYVISGKQVSFSQAEVRGAFDLAWAIGSGRVGHSFVFARDGQLFQAPVSWYAKPGRWDVSPGYQRKTGIDLTRVVEPACLQCHTTGATLGEAKPWREDGIGCERCHGPGEAHAVQGDPAKIVHPGKLDAARRDSVCQQCHLTGAARVARRGKETYEPGKLLAASVAVFTWSDAELAPATVTSHSERLRHSACAKGAGAAFTCTTCHDPHGGTPTAKIRASCQKCHDKKPCQAPLAARRAQRDDCLACHMPKTSGLESSEHGVYTDHAIPRRPISPGARSAARTLVPFFAESDDRDLALAHAVVAAEEPALRRRGFDLLRAAFDADPQDVPVASQLAWFHDRLGQAASAERLYRHVLERDPAHVAANANLGSALAKAGQLTEALDRWRRALAGNPAQTGVRLNVAVALFRSGQRDEALAALQEALRFDPAHEPARRLLREMQAAR